MRLRHSSGSQDDSDEEERTYGGESPRRRNSVVKRIIRALVKPGCFRTFFVALLCILVVGLTTTSFILYYDNTRLYTESNTRKSNKYSSTKRLNCKPPPTYAKPFLLKTPVRQERPTLILNARIMREDGTFTDTLHDIFIIYRKIDAITPNIEDECKNSEYTIIDAEGRLCTPGIIDMHSHVGLHNFPQLKGDNDVNERSRAATPFARAIDAFNPSDKAIQLNRDEGGVTTSMILPGSSNVIAGEVLYIKHRNTSRVVEMVFENTPRGIKIAAGENPKHSTHSRSLDSPMTRMGVAWVLRSNLKRASDLLNRQDLYDCDIITADQRPSDMELDVLVALLRGENVRVNAHVYKSNDMEMLIRIAQEYNIKSLSFHHATEAYKIADILRENNISTAIFTDNWGKKSEAWDASVHMPKILVDSGVKMAIKSDHPIINGKNLIYDAAKAMFYGMSPDATMRAITSVPASIIGVSDRIGALKEGYDGDIVLWDKHPLSLGARPDTIIIDGNVVLHRNHAIVSTSLEPEYMPEPATETLELNNAPIITETHDFKCYAVKGAVIHVQDEKDTIIQSGTIVVVHGTIKCMKQTCEIPPSCNVYQSSHPIHIIPGLIESSSSLGLVEIVTESQAHEGSAETRNKGENPDLHAIDGLRLFNSRTIPAARKNGVTVSISHPKNDALVMGTSVAYYLLDNHRIEEVLVKETTGLHITLGIDSVHDLNNAVMAQLHDLRVLLEKKQKEILSRKLKRKSELGNLKDQLLNNDIVVRVLRKEIPLVAHVNQVDVMNHLLRMQKLFKFRLVIVGGAEAHLIAKTLAKQEVSVIITPSKKGHAAHQRWDTMLTDSCDFGISILHSAGVKLGISVGYAHYARDLRWIAGKVQQSGNEQGKRVLKESQTLAMITKNVAQMFGLYEQGLGQLREKDVANFVVLIGKNVLTFESRVRVVAVGSRVETKPIQR